MFKLILERINLNCQVALNGNSQDRAGHVGSYPGHLTAQEGTSYSQDLKQAHDARVRPRSPHMTELAKPRGPGRAQTPWLTAAEVDSWLSVVRLMTWLPWSIDQQLRRDANLGMVEYQVLARLSNQPGR